jgi:hypothetical protein
MSPRTAHRARWILVLALVGIWFVAFGLGLGIPAVHLILLAAIVLLVYQLLAAEVPV